MIAILQDNGYITRDDNGLWRVFLTPRRNHLNTITEKLAVWLPFQ